ncbi:unnamed protein product [Rhizoctonia solani]|uniref:HNH nuclease domain-containing protein n=1 Tax=Rhizoctonia solani TaxID=456999 RepID=A0A8H3A849_9AGAM|nr:unnamed protein product [Rhizoctonia solani]
MDPLASITQTPSPETDDNDATFAHPAPSARTKSTKSRASTVTKNSNAGFSTTSCATENARAALTEIAPDGYRCLITRQLYDLECCHLVPRCTRVAIRLQLENVWGIETKKFRIYDAYNMLWLDASTHRSFDNCKWVLLPTKEDLAAVVAFDSSRVGNTRASSNYLEVHEYPFESLGLLQSHVHPLYVVYDVGTKVHSMLDPELNTKLGCPLIETPESDPYQAPSDSSHLPSTSGSRYDRSTQNQERDERHRRRNETSGAQNPLPSGRGAGAGAPQGRDCTAVTSTTDKYLPTPDQSMYSADRECRLEATSGTNFPSLHWVSPDDWVAGVKSSVCEDPHSGGTEGARQALVEYRREVARVAPCGPWEEWIPEYELV